MHSVWQDFRFGLRTMLARPLFTLVAVVCIGLGIGLNTTIFSVINTLFFRPLPVEQPDRLVRMFTSLSEDFPYASFSYPDYVDYNAAVDIFDGVVAHRPLAVSATLDGPAELMFGTLVSGNFFDVLGVQAILGRTFTLEEATVLDTYPVVVLAHGYWVRRFGARPEVVGSKVTLNGKPFTVIGIAPPNFRGIMLGVDSDAFFPIMQQAVLSPTGFALDNRGSRSLQVTARLKDGVTVEQARVAAELVGERLAAEYPSTNENARPLLIPQSEANLPPNMKSAAGIFSMVLMAAVGLVLLIACANVANLLLARSRSRTREMGVRLALGAPRWRLIRQLLTESVLLGLAGGGLGVGLAWTAVQFVSSIQPPTPVPVYLDFPLDQSVLLFTLGLSLATSFLFGLAPAYQATRISLLEAIKRQDAGSGGRSRFGLGNVLSAGQIALSLILLVAAGLFFQSLTHALDIDPGFETKRILLAALDVSQRGYSEAAGENFYGTLLDRVRTLPGVESATLGRMVSFSLGGTQTALSVPGYEPGPGESMTTDYNIVAPGYFETLSLPLIGGRGFSSQDGPDSQRVMVVNRAFADRYFRGRDPLGQTVKLSRDYTVVGVSENFKLNSLGEEPVPYFYLSFTQSYRPNMILHLRTEQAPASLAAALRREIQAMDPDLPVVAIRTMEEQVGVSLFPARVGAGFLGAFSLLALTLALIGLYGVMAYWVSRRTREIGIRMALGAEKSDVLSMVLKRGLAIAGVGILVGVTCSVLVNRFLESVLYGVDVQSLTTYLWVTGFLVLTVLAASYLPARRALRGNPLRALRYEG